MSFSYVDKQFAMKNIYILFILILIGCQDNASQKSEVATQTPPPDPASEKYTPQRATGSIYTPEQLAEVEEPSRGGPAKIEGAITGANAGMAKMIGRYVEQTYVIDSAIVDSKGRFTFTNDEGYPMGQYYILFNDNKVSFVSFLGEDQQFKVSGDASDLNGTLSFKGSPDNEAFLERIQYAAIMNPKFNELNQKLTSAEEGSAEFKALSEEQKANTKEWKSYLQKIYDKYPNSLYVAYTKATQNPEFNYDVDKEVGNAQFREEFWDGVDLTDRRLLRTDVVEKKLNNYFDKFTPQHHDSIYKGAKNLLDRKQHPEFAKYLTNYLMFKYDPKETTLMDPQAVYVNMVQNHYNKEQAFWMDSMQIYGIQRRANEMSNSLIGQKGPDVIANDQFGNPQSIYQKTADYIIVYMYTPTCEHCQEQSPKLVTWYNEWKNKGADVYAIAVDTNDEEWKDYIAKTGMNFTNVHDPTNKSIYAKYFVDTTPELYVLNKERKIIGKNLKVNQIEIVMNQDKEKRK